MKELLDSTSLADDPDSLRARLGVHGYLYFRGLLPTGPVDEAGSAVTAALSAGGWIDHSGHPSGQPRAVSARDAIRDPAYLAALTNRPFNRIPYLPRLRSLTRSLLGANTYSYPVKVLRAVYPEAAQSRVPLGRHIHQDYAVGQVSDMLTTWIPLMPIPEHLGGLAILPGSHLQPPKLPRLLSPAQSEWATTNYTVGDVLLFHCLTSHAALPNQSNRLRLSQDTRWQSADQPFPERMVYGPTGRRKQGVEVFSRILSREPWWEPLPPTITIAENGRQPGGPWSRFFPVHPAWSRWQPRPEPVH